MAMQGCPNGLWCIPHGIFILLWVREHLFPCSGVSPNCHNGSTLVQVHIDLQVNQAWKGGQDLVCAAATESVPSRAQSTHPTFCPCPQGSFPCTRLACSSRLLSLHQCAREGSVLPAGVPSLYSTTKCFMPFAATFARGMCMLLVEALIKTGQLDL